jgi:mRNA interferase MazF
LSADRFGIVKNSVILLEQIRTIDKSRLREKVCHLDAETMNRISESLKISLALDT